MDTFISCQSEFKELDIRGTKTYLSHLISSSHLICQEMNLDTYSENKSILKTVTAMTAQQFASITPSTSSII